MIKLKSGKNIEVEENLDKFFEKLLNEIINEVEENLIKLKKSTDDDKYFDEDQILLKEIMDESIFVTRQLFDLYAVNKNIAQFLMTGFLFNSIVQSIPSLRSSEPIKEDEEKNNNNDDEKKIH